MDFVGVAVLVGRTNTVPVTVPVAVEPVAVIVGVPIASVAPKSVGVNVHNSGNDR
jgi:hypothetical protein